jgi:hypothetical protein
MSYRYLHFLQGALITPDETILLRNWKQRYLPNAPSRIVEDPIVVSDLDEHELPKTIRESTLLVLGKTR